MSQVTVRDAPSSSRTILVTGSTGYIGGRLVPRLLKTGYRVRVLVRGSRERLRARPWVDDVEVVTGDVLDPSDALASTQGDIAPVYLTQEQGVVIERRQKRVSAPAETAFQVFTRIGGDRG